MFDAMVHGRIDLEGLEFAVRLADIEALNAAAFAGEADVTKLSFHAYAYCADDYVLLDAGSALGRNCGPLLISRRGDLAGRGRVGRAADRDSRQVHDREFPAGPRVSAGDRTRPNALLGHRGRSARRGASTPASSSTRTGSPTRDRGLRKIIDLGEFWESETGAAIPLGGIVDQPPAAARREAAVNRVLRRSVEYAFANRTASLPFVRAHAQAMSDDVMYKHIDLYVNEYSVDLGVEGRRAVEVLFERARASGVIPAVR